jgi:hypothetical protein
MSRKRARPAARKALYKLRRKVFLMEALAFGRWLHHEAVIVYQGERISYLECKKRLTEGQMAAAQRRVT